MQIKALHKTKKANQITLLPEKAIFLQKLSPTH